MRSAGLTVLLCLGFAPPLLAQDKKINPRELDKQLFDVLKEVHNRGADMYNAGDASGSYRVFQGCLQTTRAVLNHRPGEQKFIDDALAEADKDVSVARRAFILHEAIEKLRTRLRLPPAVVKEGSDPEFLTIPPREFKQEQKEPEPKKFAPPKDGVFGRIYWKGQPLADVHVLFVSRGALDIRVYEAVSDSEGRYSLEKMRPGLYTVLLIGRDGKKQALPERYETATTSPLISEVKGGDTLDFMLQ